MPGEPTYEELKSTCESLQSRVDTFETFRQRLISAEDALDRERARFQALQRFTEEALSVANPSEFATIAVESLIEAFELECAVIFHYDQDECCLRPVASFGFASLPQTFACTREQLDRAGICRQDKAVIIDADHPLMELLGSRYPQPHPQGG